MPLSPGDTFGPYRLLAAIGKGGMGEVWKARDIRLDRIVAMKFSQEQFSERFEREAKAIGALNHPNICTLYDVGPNYLVMEYVELRCRVMLLYLALLASAMLIAASCAHHNVVAKTPAPLGDREIHDKDIDKDDDRDHDEDARHPAPWEPPEDLRARQAWFQERKQAAAKIHEVQTLLGTATSASTTPSTTVNPFQWTFIGPQPIVTTGSSSDPFAGSVGALAIDPHNSCVVYAGTFVGKLWKTTDCGTTWQPLSDSGPLVQIQSISVDPVLANTVYVLDAGSIYTSTDGGLMWTELPPPQGVFGWDTLAIHPSVGGTWLASQSGSIWRTTDAGAMWTPVYSLSNSILDDLQFNAGDGSYVYAAGIMRTPSSGPTVAVVESSDAGATWTNTTTGLPTTTPDLTHVGLALAPSNPTTAYLRAESYPAASLVLQLYKTVDAGGQWTALTSFPSDVQNPRTPSLTAVFPTSSSTVFAGGLILYVSGDGGNTWARADNGLHNDHHAMVFAPDGSRYYESNDGGVWRTDTADAAAGWINLNAAFGTAEFYDVRTDPTNLARAFGGTQDNGTLQYSGALGWSPAGVCGDGFRVAINPISPAIVYASCNGGIFESVTGGTPGSWAPLTNGLPDLGGVYVVFTMDPSSPQTLYIPAAALYQTLDGGLSWHQVGNGVIAGNVVAVSPADSNVVLAADINSVVWGTTNALAGSQSTWIQVSTFFSNNGGLFGIVIDPANPRKIYGLTTSGGLPSLAQSDDGGASWQIQSLAPNVAGTLTGLVLDPDLPSTWYLTTFAGVFRSSDAGNTWYPLASGFPFVVANTAEVNRASRTLRVATAGRGAWDLAVPTTAPRLSNVSVAPPSSSSGFTLTVIGVNFDSTCSVQLNSASLATNFVSATQLTAAVPAGTIPNAAGFYIAVYKPGNGGGLSDPLLTSIGPTILAGGIQNAAASVNPSLLSPGTLASIYGVQFASQPAQATVPFPVVLGGVKVLVNGIAAPLYYVSATQINFVVPWEVSGVTQATVTVQAKGITSNPVSVAITAAAPQIFTVNQQGTGQGDVLIAGTASLAAPVGAFPGSRPVQKGEYISIFDTGLGAVQNQPSDGSPPSSLSPSAIPAYVNMGCTVADSCVFVAQFSGLAPGFVGLYQVNVQIPADALSGDAVPLQLFPGNDFGPGSNIVTIAIQ